MKCPKCGFEDQFSNIECPKCGIIYKKYFKTIKKANLQPTKDIKAEEATEDKIPGVKSSRSNLLFWKFKYFFIGILSTLICVFLFINLQKKEYPKNLTTTDIGEPTYKTSYSKSIQNQTTELNGNAIAPDNEKIFSVSEEYINNIVQRKLEEYKIEKSTELDVKKTEISDNSQPDNSETLFIEKARESTIKIETQFGTGSGFFISNNGYIITNRHVIDIEMSSLKSRFDSINDQLEKKNEILASIDGQLNNIESNLKIYKRKISQNRKELEILEKHINQVLDYHDRIASSNYQNYNRKLQEYNDIISQYNNSIKNYEAILKEYKIQKITNHAHRTWFDEALSKRALSYESPSRGYVYTLMVYFKLSGSS